MKFPEYERSVYISAILPLGLEKNEFDGSTPTVAAAQKSTLERTSESAEKAAISTHPVAVQPSPKNQSTDHMHSPMGSPPINPRDIPLEHCGGTRDPRDQPRDVRDKLLGKDVRDRDLSGSEAMDSYEEKREGKRDLADGNEPGGGERFRSRSKSALQEDDKDRSNDGRGDRADKARDKDLWGEKRSEDAEKAKEADRDREAVEKTSPRELGRKRGDSFTKSFSPHRSPSPGAQRKQSPSLRTTRIKSPDSTAHLPDETEPGWDILHFSLCFSCKLFRTNTVLKCKFFYALTSPYVASNCVTFLEIWHYVRSATVLKSFILFCFETIQKIWHFETWMRHMHIQWHN